MRLRNSLWIALAEMVSHLIQVLKINNPIPICIAEARAAEVVADVVQVIEVDAAVFIGVARRPCHKSGQHAVFMPFA